MIANTPNFDILLQAKNNLKPVVFKKIIQNCPDWSVFINAIDYKFNNPSSDGKVYHGSTFITTPSGAGTDIFLNTKLSPSFWNADASQDFDTNRVPFIKEYTDQFINVFGSFIQNNSWTIKALTNFASNENVNSIHKDKQDVLSWHCINTVEYRFFDVDQSLPFETNLDLYDHPYTSILLEEGDVIFMPAGLVHQAIILEPRATLLLDFFLKQS